MTIQKKLQQKQNMEALMNKKNTNRIFRKRLNSIQYDKSHSIIHNQTPRFYSKIKSSQINNINLLRKLDNQKYSFFNEDEDLIKMTRFTVSERCNQLSKPKSSRNKTSSLLQTLQPNQNKSFIRKSIRQNTNLYKLSKTQQIFYPSNSKVTKQRSSRRSSSLQSKTLDDDDLLLFRNVINSSKLGKLSAYEILKVKQQQQFKKQLILGIIKSGQRLSNQVENDQLNLFQQLSHPIHQISKLQQLVLYPSQALDKLSIEKYKYLISTINQSQQKYALQPYDQYHQKLVQKTISTKRKPKLRKKLLLNSGQEWC